MAKSRLKLKSVWGSLLTNQMVDDNFNALVYASGPWAAGTYEPEEVVDHHGFLWRCLTSTTQEPSTTATDWAIWPDRGSDIMDAAPIADITALTPLVLSANPVDPTPGSIFDVVGGNLVAKIASNFAFEVMVIWTPTTTSNDDAGLVLTLAVRSGTATLPISAPFGSLFQSSRSNSSAMGATHFLGIASVSPGDVIGIDANIYSGQTGTTSLDQLTLFAGYM